MHVPRSLPRQVLWQALRPGGVYFVEDTSENYIESPFLDPSTFMAFMKQAVDVVQVLPQPALPSSLHLGKHQLLRIP